MFLKRLEGGVNECLYSREFCLFPVPGHFWIGFEGLKVGRFEGGVC